MTGGSPHTTEQLLAEIAQLRERLATYEQPRRGPSADGHYFSEMPATDVSKSADHLATNAAVEPSLFDSVLDMIPDLVWLKDASGVYLMCNREFTRLVNRTKQEIIGQTDYDLFPKKKADAYRAYDKLAIVNRSTSINEETADFTYAGYSTWIETSKTPLYDQQGELIGVLGIGRDIGRRKEAAEASEEKQHFLNLILDSSPVPIWIGSPNGITLRANQALYRAVNLSPDRVVGLYNLFEDGNFQQKEIAEKIDQVLTNKSTIRFDLCWQPELVRELDLSDVPTIHIDACLFPLLDRDGNITNLIMQWVDIGERKQAEERLRKSESSLKEAQQLAQLGNWELDVATSQFNWSDQVDRIFGYEPGEVTFNYDSFRAIVHPDDRAIIDQTYDTLASGEQSRFEYRAIRKDGEVRWISGVGDATFDSQDNPIRMFGTVQDITERRQAEENYRLTQQQLLEQREHEKARVEKELQRTREELVRSTRLAAIGQLSGSIAHELRNPLGAVRNAAYYLREHGLKEDEKVKRFLEVIDRQTSRADRIINNLLELTRAKKPITSVVDLHQIVSAAMEQVPQCDKLLVTMKTDADPFLFSADSGQFKQVIANLINNALQAMGGEGELSINAYAEHSSDIIEFQDTGPGIATEVRETLFEPLVTSKTTGTGLGLSICRQIIHRHGGCIEAVDIDRPGATFKITLPRHRSTGN